VEDPPEPVLLGSDERSVKCVHGLTKLSHWTGTEVLNRSDFFVAAPIVGYNMFMNGVDHMDQYRSTLPMQRKELQLYMTIFTFLLDLAVSQAYAIHQKCSEHDRASCTTFFNFKQKVCELLVTPFMSSSKACRDQHASNTPSPSEDNEAKNNNTNTIDSTVGVIVESHVLVENLPRLTNLNVAQGIDCFLCQKMGKELKTSYSSVASNVG
jgi:hypothetical protein